MDSSAFNRSPHEISGNALLWLGLGVPSILAWFGAGLSWLLAPHLGIEPDPLTWALYSAGGWYALMIAIFGGWIGLLFLASVH